MTPLDLLVNDPLVHRRSRQFHLAVRRMMRHAPDSPTWCIYELTIASRIAAESERAATRLGVPESIAFDVLNRLIAAQTRIDAEGLSQSEE